MKSPPEMTNPGLRETVEAYRASAPLAEASTIPGTWYVDAPLAELERQAVFGRTWQLAGRVDQVSEAGQYLTAEVAGEPIAVVRGGDKLLRAFYNVCRHHAAAVLTRSEGRESVLRCPYHGWTYTLEGALKGVPEFEGVCDFDRARNGLVPVQVGTWEKFVLVNLDPAAPPLQDFLGSLVDYLRPLELASLSFAERRTYMLNCNWKVFVDNYLDGGYHVPHLHRGLNSVLEYVDYKIENHDRFCLQSSPIRDSGAETSTAAVRQGRAFYFWQYPNFMINCYRGVMDTNLVLPLATDRCQVIFDFYFADVGESSQARNHQSIEVSERIQDEDVAICESVQRGLSSRAYVSGRLSVRREAGEQLFHRLLSADLKAGLDRQPMGC